MKKDNKMLQPRIHLIQFIYTQSFQRLWPSQIFIIASLTRIF
jgi:hypothetical protein